jgi:thiamine biosynthesis lipoprotein
MRPSLLTVALLLLHAVPVRAEPRAIRHALPTMGTTATVTLVGTDSVALVPVATLAHAQFRRVDSLMSNWTRTSELARIHAHLDAGPVVVEDRVAGVLAHALRIGRESGGAFDVTVEPLVRAWGFLGGRPRVPGDSAQREAFRRCGQRFLEFESATRTLRSTRTGVRIDLGGIAKGHGVDAAHEALRGAGVRQALVDLSGNMRVIGTSPAGGPWRIGVRDPRDRVPFLGRLTLQEQAVATSGKYEQFVAADGRTYGHIMDPRTGRPAEGLISVTVLAPTALDADGWGTALFVMGGEQARRLLRARPDLEGILVEPAADGVDLIWVESSLRHRFELEPAAAGIVRLRWF